MEVAQGITVWALPLIFAVTLHEAAHGYAALALGDDTARRMGRLSLNPLRHVDPFGSILLPLLLLAVGGMVFGWAKPVPINFSRLRGKRLGMAGVAIAGPATNFFLAALAVLLTRLVPHMPQAGQAWLALNLRNAIFLNLLLAVFNMVPLLPLDGGRVVAGLLPRPLALRYAKLESAGFLIILILLFVLPLLGRFLHLQLDLFSWLLGGAVQGLATMLVHVLGSW